MANDIAEKVEKRFLDELKHHLAGWRAKVLEDFGAKSFDSELAQLKSDPLYPKFNLATAEYVNIRFIGRMSISIGRRLGEIYDKIPRFLAAARFGLTPSQVAPVIKGLELDICLNYASLTQNGDAEHVKKTLANVLPRDNISSFKGTGIEIRYNFNPNDSSRLRKDVTMAENLIANGLLPVYLIFSSISPRDEAIKRLTNAGWRFIIGQEAIDFSATLFGLDLSSILDRDAVQTTIKTEIDGMMNDLKLSHAFMQFASTHYQLK